MPPESVATEKTLQRRYWLLAAVLFIGGGLGAAPSDALHEPTYPPTIYLLPLLAIVSGLVCFALANHVSRRWLHLMTAVATLEIALTVWLASDIFAIYYILVAFYAAYVFQSRKAIGLQFAFASLAALVPIAYEPETARRTLEQGLVLIPTLLLTAGAITFLREKLEASEMSYRLLAERDPLTGVANYRVLTERLPVELERHSRHRHSLALLLLDLNDFKRVNDEHGHQYGDRVLQEVAGALMGSVRSHDIVVRHGGDEFSVIAPETDRRHAEALATRLRECLAGISVHGRPLGACSGCAVFPDDAATLNELLAHADVELRASKSSRPRPARPPLATDRPVPAAE
ncbi:MAG: GGDEF domain-containing protein [Solirubrobacterales bacterium]